ncbi:glycosyltransferase family 2 protein [Raoultibacter timonensis]|uniref:Glycosyl transferase n=1 Tax=Raoultibacter timonensis TaxID=1907662 RepID=A0ABM7WI99_9ACTN|nr:glycosyltransferase family 2 protein [Raoultibacter timonensis]BDE95990.1 glycosyl transferase [Raoultibacter timonensis]BDF50594.1 glycosyl transferase [Raoultibacter timonensis]
MGKLLTIAMPCYNVEAYLERGLGSLADDRFADDLEVLIVNDGSTDSTKEIALRYVESHPTIFRLIDKENGGHGSGINAGIAHAAGTYFRIVDGDDWVDTDNLATLLDRLRSIDSDIVVDEKREVDMGSMSGSLVELPAYIEVDKELQFADICNLHDTESFIAIHTLTVKTSLLREHGISILEGIFYVDYEYIVKATCFADTVTFIPLEIYQYLVGNANQSVAAENWVKRYSHHETVVKELLRFSETDGFSAPIHEYLVRKTQLLINTHYKVLLIFDKDRRRGASRAKEFRLWLKREYPAFAALTAARYRQALGMHYLGVDAARLDAIMGR